MTVIRKLFLVLLIFSCGCNEATSEEQPIDLAVIEADKKLELESQINLKSKANIYQKKLK